MSVISRPFDKDKVENRELAAMVFPVALQSGVDTAVCRHYYVNGNTPCSYDMLAMSIMRTTKLVELPTTVMRLAHHGVLSVIEGLGHDYHYQLSPGMVELIEEIKNAVSR